MANRVKIAICGKVYNLQCEESQTYMSGLAATLDRKIKEFMDENESASLPTAAIMVALSLLDDSNKSSGDVDNFRAQIKGYVEEAAEARIEADKLKREVRELQTENEALRNDLALLQLKDDVNAQ